ncbi:hypothetical protein ASD58_15475 [Duganella sp. Root1480D1]|nr:hypothetical protein ASD58_15475 [Duganella sp. Root1480D1]
MLILLAACSLQGHCRARVQVGDALHQAIDMSIRRPIQRPELPRQARVSLSHDASIRLEAPQLPFQRRKNPLHRAPLFDDLVQYWQQAAIPVLTPHKYIQLEIDAEMEYN